MEHSFDAVPGTSASGGGTSYVEPGGRWYQVSAHDMRIVQDPSAPTGGTRSVVEVTWRRGLDDGEQNGAFWGAQFGHQYKELYGSYRFRLVGADWENQCVGLKALGYLSYGDQNRANQFFWQMSKNPWPDNGPCGVQTGPWQLISEPTMEYNQWTPQYVSNNRGTGNLIRPDQWSHVEVHLKQNTKNADGSYNRDGVIRQWINGVLVQEATDIVFLSSVTAPRGDLGFYELHFDPIWGGNSNQFKTRDDRAHYDHIYLSGIRK